MPFSPSRLRIAWCLFVVAALLMIASQFLVWEEGSVVSGRIEVIRGGVVSQMIWYVYLGVKGGMLSESALYGQMARIGVMIQILMVPVFVPVLRQSRPLLWLCLLFGGCFTYWQVAGIRYSSVFMGIFESYSQIGPGRWAWVASFCLHTAGLLLLAWRVRKSPVDPPSAALDS